MEEDRGPGEIVETYRPPVRETVEVYARPLPDSLRPPEKPVKRKKRRWLLPACIGAAAGVLAMVVILAVLAWWQPWVYRYPPGIDGPYAADEEAEEPLTVDLPRYEPEEPLSIPLAAETGEALTPQEIYQRVNPAVVMLQVRAGKSGYLGTGLIFTSDGYLLTNYHMVEGGETCKALLPGGSVYWASYVAGDRDSDIAVLKLDGEDLPTAELGDSSLLTVGDKVYAIGNPLNTELRGTFTDGIISAIDRSVSVEDRNMELIQTNAAMNSGNSGGPLVNEYGQVVGINTVKMVSRYSNVEGLGFAIPTTAIRDIVAELMDTGTVFPDPLLGISVSQLGDPLPGGRAGLLIQSVTPDSAADEAGVRKGDYLLTADGEAITFSTDLYLVRRRFRGGGVLTLTLWRNGEIVTADLELDDG